MVLADMADAGQVVALLVSLLAVAAGVWKLIVFSLRLRDGWYALVRKVDIMWGFQLRRGQTEAENSGVMTDDGPGRSYLPERVRERFGDLADDLHAFYRAEGRRMADAELKLEIEGRFGPRIVADVCRPLRWHEGACLHAAAIIAREAGDGVLLVG